MSRFGTVKGSARREAWGTSVEVDEGLFRIRLDNPLGSLLVNSYAYKSAKSLLIFDPGWPWTLDALEAAVRDLGLAQSFVDVDAWIYTHTHIDHMGGAALLCDVSDAPHYAWSPVEQFASRWHTFQDAYADWSAWGRASFVGDELFTMLQTRNRALNRRGELLLGTHGERELHNFVGLEFGDRLAIADLQLDFIDARGHDPYHGAYFDASRGWLFSGDVVIATPTPISAPMGDDIYLYYASLDRLQGLNASLLLPGHGVQRGGDLALAFDRSRKYQDAVRDTALRVLSEATVPLNLLEVGLRSTPDHQPYEPQPRWLVHLALLDTHLRKLEDEGHVVRSIGPRWARAMT